MRLPLTAVAVAVASLLNGVASSAGPYTESLAKKGSLAIERTQCEQVERQLGQLFYVSVYGYDESKGPIEEHYYSLVKELGLGGVLPHYSNSAANSGGGGADISALTDATKRLQRASPDLPLLVGVDYVHIGFDRNDPMAVPTPGTDPSKLWSTFGLGYSGGTMSDIGLRFSPSCAEWIAEANALVQKAIGLNIALGPTVENSPTVTHGFGTSQSTEERKVLSSATDAAIQTASRRGLASTLKHFPYTGREDLHKNSVDEPLVKAEVLKKMDLFNKFGGQADFVMTTHLFNSEIDPNDLATFSKPWIQLLRNEVGFDGLIMTDGLFMIRNYALAMKTMSYRWDPEKKTKIKTDESIFAARAILAGHDIVLLEGNAESTRQVFRDLHALSCENSEIGNELRSRVTESYNRIVRYKNRNHAALLDTPRVPDDLMAEIASNYNKLKSVGYSGIPGTPPPTCQDAESLAILKKMHQIKTRALLPPLPRGRTQSMVFPDESVETAR